MSFSFGFYNALNHDRLYDAIQVSEIFDGLIRDGVYSTIGDHYVVKASENENEVIVGSGRAWFDHTWNKNDADLPITAPLPDLLMKRYDALVIDINANVASRTNQIMWVEGTPSLNTPVKPTLTNTTDHHQYPLCYILRTANNNTIIQDDIENTIGTDECPFVTGILQQVSISDLLLQWTSQFATFMNNNEATASAWENEWEASMNAWTVEQKNEFATWMAGEKTEFDDWFANLHYILDGDVAGHLQNEIDAIEAGLGGSVFTIHTINSSLYGKTVTCTGSTQEKTAVFDASGNAEIKGITDVGTITFTATDGSQTATTQISVPYFSNYPITMAFWAATVNLSTTSEDLKGKTITVRKGGAVVGSTSFNAAGAATYTATSAGTYTFTCQGYSVEQAITEETTYNVTINSGLSLSAWITAGSTTDYPLNPSSYANFAALEADEEAIRQLMLVHNAVDYLATAGADDALIEDVINSDICAKWINLSDYALDTLSANANIKSVMDTADKYGYGEWVYDGTSWGPEGNVPIMTANNAPYGTVAVSAERSADRAGWKAFRGVMDNSFWNPSSSATFSNTYIGYKFVNPTKVKKIAICVLTASQAGTDPRGYISKFDVRASNDGFSTYDTIASNVSLSENVGLIDYEIDAENYYLEYRVYITANTSNIAENAVVRMLQFYGRELKPLVPTMTSNTTPKGTVTYSSQYDTNSAAWKAFNESESNGWTPSTSDTFANNYVQYEFDKSQKINKCAFWWTSGSSYRASATAKVYGSVDGISYTEIGTVTAIQTTGKNIINIIEGDYKAIKCNIASKAAIDSGASTALVSGNGYKFQFYGFDYSEKEFAPGSTRKTIYDHGVELETISQVIQSGGSGSITKESNQIIVGPTGTSGHAVFAEAKIPSSGLNTLRVKCGNRWYIGALGAATNSTFTTGFAYQSFADGDSNLPDNLSLDISQFTQGNSVSVWTTRLNIPSSFTEMWLE